MTTTEDNDKIPPGVQVNWMLLKQAMRLNKESIVVCTTPSGDRYNVICALNEIPKTDGTTSWEYAPFGILVGQSIKPLMDSLQPPPGLIGRWRWPPDKYTPTGP